MHSNRTETFCDDSKVNLIKTSQTNKKLILVEQIIPTRQSYQKEHLNFTIIAFVVENCYYRISLNRTRNSEELKLIERALSIDLMPRIEHTLEYNTQLREELKLIECACFNQGNTILMMKL